MLPFTAMGDNRKRSRTVNVLRILAALVVGVAGPTAVHFKNVSDAKRDAAQAAQEFELVTETIKTVPDSTAHAGEPAVTYQQEPGPTVPPAAAAVLVLRFQYTIENQATSAWTPDDDPEHPHYSSLHFLRGSARADLYDPLKPFPKADTRVMVSDYSVAIPADRKHLFEERVPDGRTMQTRKGPVRVWGHAWRIRIEGYTPAGVWAKPATRITTRARFDVLMTGWNARSRAWRWGIPKKDVEVWKLLWTSGVKPGDVLYADVIRGGR